MLVQAGVNASSEQVLEWLVKADTASAFNISFGDVSVTGVQQVCQKASDVSLSEFQAVYATKASRSKWDTQPCKVKAMLQPQHPWCSKTIITEALDQIPTCLQP